MTRADTVVARGLPVILLLTALLLLAGGCNSNAESAVAHARDRVASAVHLSLNRHGVPVEDGVVNCEGPAAGGAIYCDATTAYEPQAEVLARFLAGPAGQRDRCPGILEITVGGASLVRTAEDPCR